MGLPEPAWRRCEGIGSRGHVVGWLERRSLDTSASVRGQKEKIGVWAVDLVGWGSCVSGGENWLLIVLVLFVKKVVKSSAVIDVVGGGEGGQRNLLYPFHYTHFCPHKPHKHAHTHTHTHVVTLDIFYICTYIYMCVFNIYNNNAFLDSNIYVNYYLKKSCII